MYVPTFVYQFDDTDFPCTSQLGFLIMYANVHLYDAVMC